MNLFVETGFPLTIVEGIIESYWVCAWKGCLNYEGPTENRCGELGSLVKYYYYYYYCLTCDQE